MMMTRKMTPMNKSFLTIALLAAAAATTTAQAQSTPPAAGASAPAVISPAKRDLLQRLITLQQPALENMARNLAEQPVRQMLGAAEQALPRVPEAKREAVVNQIQADARKYFDEAGVVVKDRSAKLGQTALVPLFDEKFSEDELRQLLVALEAPAYKKYQTALPELSNAFAQKLILDLRPVLDPKLKALEESIGKSLGVQTAAEGAAPAASKPKAPTAAKPKK
jgi:hypothetical protein